MDQSLLANLRKTITEESVDGLRHLFLDALDGRRFDECEALLEIADESPLPALRHARQHYTAVLLYEKRQYDQAENILRTLLEQPISQPQRTRTCSELAILLDELGQWLEAESFYQAAIDGYRIADNKLGLARAYNNLGIMFTCQVEQGLPTSDRLDKALHYHQEAIKLLETLSEKSEAHEEMIKNLHGMGRAYAFQQDYPLAKAAFDRFFTECQNEEYTYQRAMGLSDIAALLLQPQGQLAEATTALATALELFPNEEDDLHLAQALTRYGNLLEEQGQIEQALQSYEQAITYTELIRSRFRVSTVQAHYRATIESTYAAPMSLYLKREDALQALTLAERARSRTLADLLATPSSARLERANPLREQRALLRTQLEQVYATGVDSIHGNEIENVEAKLNALDRQIELIENPLTALDSSKALTAEEIISRLPADAAMLIYVGDREHRLHCLVVVAQQIHVVSLNPKVTIPWLQADLAPYLEGKRAGFMPDRANRLQTSGIIPQLYKLLIEPLLPYLEAARTLYIVPTGPLHSLSLAALSPHPESVPSLLQGRRVLYVPSASILFDHFHAHTPSNKQGMLILAPTEADLTVIQGCINTLNNHPASRQLVGAAANVQTLLKEASNYRILCFLGHASFHARYPMLSHLKLADGHLQAGEILHSLRMDADLVILAACESGRGQALRGDELLGLTRAILYAGTPSVLATLWRVHEIPTRLLLEHLWQHSSMQGLSEGDFDPALALAESQNWLRTLTYAEFLSLVAKWSDQSTPTIEHYINELWKQSYPGQTLTEHSRLFAHPYFWSPYILIGEGRVQHRQS